MNPLPSSPLVFGIATRNWPGWQDCVQSWHATSSRARSSAVPPPPLYPSCLAEGMDVLPAFQYIYERTTEPIIAYLHDDLVIREPDWDRRVLRQFSDPSVGLVGFAGALGHGLPNLYTSPFHIPNLIRREFLSNLPDAERHGYRFEGETDVAVLDGMALFVRRAVLDRWGERKGGPGGWPVKEKVGYFLYSETLCCEVRRQEMRIRLVGVNCEHLGGKSSGVPLPYSYEEEHFYLWDTNRDMLPFYVK